MEAASREREARGPAFIGVEAGVWGFPGSLFIGEFKHKGGKLKHRKRKNEGPNGQLLKSTKVSKAQGPRCGAGAGALPLSGVWLADSSRGAELKWALGVTKEKKQLSGFTLQNALRLVRIRSVLLLKGVISLPL